MGRRHQLLHCVIHVLDVHGSIRDDEEDKVFLLGLRVLLVAAPRMDRRVPDDLAHDRWAREDDLVEGVAIHVQDPVQPVDFHIVRVEGEREAVRDVELGRDLCPEPKNGKLSIGVVRPEDVSNRLDGSDVSVGRAALWAEVVERVRARGGFVGGREVDSGDERNLAPALDIVQKRRCVRLRHTHCDGAHSLPPRRAVGGELARMALRPPAAQLGEGGEGLPYQSVRAAEFPRHDCDLDPALKVLAAQPLKLHIEVVPHRAAPFLALRAVHWDALAHARCARVHSA
mmetsp:Transcript_63984/g.202453  ORF Transcript_63984/g.202453 Transcript_63984/m.202453 type:complete len:285 (+) Transcript_63984:511-1365(+)